MFVLFSLVMWFAEKPLESFFEDDVAGVEICRRISNWEEPRLNIAVKAEGYGATKQCRARVSAYIPKSANLSAVTGQVKLFDDKQPVGSPSSLRLDLRAGGTGMMTADTNLPLASGKACNGLQAELELAACYSKTGQKISCPHVRVVDDLVFEQFEVSGEELRVCYDE